MKIIEKEGYEGSETVGGGGAGGVMGDMGLKGGVKGLPEIWF